MNSWRHTQCFEPYRLSIIQIKVACSPALSQLFSLIVVSCALLSGCNSALPPEAELSAIVWAVSQEFNEVGQLSTSDLDAWLNDKSREPPQLLDARRPEEYGVSRLPGAILIDPDADVDEVIAMIDPSRPIVVYCSVGYRSSRLARRMILAGVTQTSNLEGSIFKWGNEGRPLIRDNGTTRLVHPYDDSYGHMLREEYRSYQ